MTREERLELLKQIEKDIHVCSLVSTLLEDAKSCAIHSVIEELEQEPCEDCINREKAKQFLYERLDRLNDDELYDIFSRIIDDMYNELSSVTLQPFINKPCISKGTCQHHTEDVLDKITTEINGNYRIILKGTSKDDWAIKWNDCLDEVLQIIDKYKAENEDRV
jgi:hypothetical protein